jgi:capsular polysaccharide export protein
LGHDPIFLSSSVSAWVKLRRLGEQVTLCRIAKKTEIIDKKLDGTIESTALQWSADRCSKLYIGAINSLNEIDFQSPISGLLIWNGGGVIGKAFKIFSQEKKKWIGFMETSNIDGKLFIDPYGVNAQSKIASEPDILNKHQISENEFENWRKEFLEKKRKSHIIPQSMKNQRFNHGAIIDLLGTIIGVPWTRTETFGAKFRRIVLHQGSACDILLEQQFDIKSTEYFFLPLQLSSDTNILLNSEVNNETAIRLSANQAKLHKNQLVVKIHPAELDVKFVKRVQTMQSQLGFIISKKNTFTLLEYANHVFTINSTAGIEARLLQRPLTIYGRSTYGKFTNEHLRNYILGWLINIDINGDAEIPPQKARELLNRCAISQEKNS